MKKLIILIGLSLIASAQADVLITKHYKITIKNNCKEGVVGCNNISYHGVSKKTGKGIKLKGKEIYKMCADGVTPCRFLGYKFNSGKVVYFISQEGEYGRLEVTNGEKVLINEKGSWD